VAAVAKLEPSDSTADRKPRPLDGPATASAQELTGEPGLELVVSQDLPGTVVAWLSDIAPDGTGVRFGVWPAAVARPGGGRSRLRFALPALHHCLLPGHRLRVSVTSSFAPIYAHGRTPQQARLEEGTLHLLLG
jgi:predicted acyl esterase